MAHCGMLFLLQHIWVYYVLSICSNQQPNTHIVLDIMKQPYHSSEIRDLCLMKCTSIEMLQNLIYFWYLKSHETLFVFHYHLVQPQDLGLSKYVVKNLKLHEVKKLCRFSYSNKKKIGKILSILQTHFFKHYPLFF